MREVDHSSVEMVEDSNSLDSLISELEKSEASQQSSASTQTSTPKPPLQKESVFVRLANRIKVRMIIYLFIRLLEYNLCNVSM